MQNLVPTQRPVPDFEPVPRKARYDGWTPERQRAFIEALAETGSVKAAAKRVNMSQEGAYYLRRQPGADSFRAAWNAALDHGVQRLADIAIERATEGVADPVFWRGEQVGEKRKYNDRLLMFILRHHLADRYGGPGLAQGTRSRETIEREAAENCPVCQAAREAAEAPEAIAETEKLARLAAFAMLLDTYEAKTITERRARLAGDVIAADFALRQMTYLELMLCANGAGDGVAALWQETFEPADRRAPHVGELARLIADAREAVWAQEDTPLRPPFDALASCCTAISGGPTLDARRRAQDEARRKLAEAQAMWEATATEEGWRRWERERSLRL